MIQKQNIIDSLISSEFAVSLLNQVSLNETPSAKVPIQRIGCRCFRQRSGKRPGLWGHSGAFPFGVMPCAFLHFGSCIHTYIYVCMYVCVRVHLRVCNMQQK